MGCVQNKTLSSVAEPVVHSKRKSSGLKFFSWNVYYLNQDLVAITEVIVPNDADIIGINEFTGDWASLIKILNSKSTHRNYVLAEGSGGNFKGYGTDIIFDSNKWEALEGGKKTVNECGSFGGDRAANWVVLKENEAERSRCTIIVGGIHLSYCANNSCDSVQECELRNLYAKYEALKEKYDNAPVVLMGDLNHGMSDPIIKNLLKGHIGDRKFFPIADMAMTEGNTYYDGGVAIQHIFAEDSGFVRISGGRTGQGITGEWLGGSDHFPVYAEVKLAC